MAFNPFADTLSMADRTESVTMNETITIARPAEFQTSRNAIALDPSNPTDNTIYVGSANGGVWKTTHF